MKITLPLPPSANAYWRHVGSRVLLSKSAREYRAACEFASAVQWKGVPLAGRVRIHADVFFGDLRGDLDNRAKQLLDGIRGRVYEDDKQVWDLRLVRHLDRDNPRVELTVEEIAA